jgi:hypothetical protein
MPEDPNQNHLDHNDFEREDLSPGGVFYFMAGLAVVGVVIYFIVVGMYTFLDRYEREHQAAISPMMTPKADTRIVTHEDTQAFPQPRLEENERTQITDYVLKADRQLLTYDWVNKDRGVVRIPIDRAMDLIAERGLPVRPETSVAAAKPASKAAPPSPAHSAAATGN